MTTANFEYHYQNAKIKNSHTQTLSSELYTAILLPNPPVVTEPSSRNEVLMTPDSKTWWRNFTGEGGPITLVGLDGADRTGHAVAHRDDRGRVTVRVRLGAG